MNCACGAGIDVRHELRLRHVNFISSEARYFILLGAEYFIICIANYFILRSNISFPAAPVSRFFIKVANSRIVWYNNVTTQTEYGIFSQSHIFTSVKMQTSLLATP